jgi:RNA polymerase sigma-70 factor (ECF subfamily)
VLVPDLATDSARAGEKPPPFAQVYAEHAAFVWRSLRRLGVRERDVEDACQEAFLVVHKKLESFRGTALRAWLFAIAMRVAADWRKRAHVRKEVVADEPPEPAAPETQTGAIDRARARQLLETILASLDEDKRAVFVAFELEGMPMAEVASALGCPVQTAYTRLHAARDHVTSAIERWKRRERIEG